MKKIFIDGDQGTTGLDIKERLKKREDLEILEISEDYRKDEEVRLAIIDEADIVFLCLPDEEAAKIAKKISKKKKIIDTSSYHRTSKAWIYGMPELDKEQREKIRKSNRVTVPGCHANGFILLVKPLIEKGILSDDSILSYNSLTGYSGGGKKMIKEYENDQDDNSDRCLKAPRQYGLSQEHKHLPEMKVFTGLKNKPIFLPEINDYYSGMCATLPLHRELTIKSKEFKKTYLESLYNIYADYYEKEKLITVYKNLSDNNTGFLSADAYSGYDNLEIIVQGNDNRGLLIARYDNLGKGACGTAIQCMNIMLGLDEYLGLNIKV
ncbi:MAG: N-acetyl-gamma-glutamyl-phosphate reductase [Clostridiales Family XIII bacterium]|jgi:N-acetyl-gamma-glutamyl-phosphate reductase|nr:N-acetyl-gamma-glutamyl-phosphate reductase [Clostridiales Family XIII bacterium]